MYVCMYVCMYVSGLDVLVIKFTENMANSSPCTSRAEATGTVYSHSKTTCLIGDYSEPRVVRYILVKRVIVA